MENKITAADVAILPFVLIFKVIKAVFWAFVWIIIVCCTLTKNR